MTPLWIESPPEPYVYGDEVFSKSRKQTGVVMSATEDMVRVRYYDLVTGDLSNYANDTPISDLINDSSK